jgi:hypothetical protein
LYGELRMFLPRLLFDLFTKIKIKGEETEIGLLIGEREKGKMMLLRKKLVFRFISTLLTFSVHSTKKKNSSFPFSCFKMKFSAACCASSLPHFNDQNHFSYLYIHWSAQIHGPIIFKLLFNRKQNFPHKHETRHPHRSHTSMAR